MKNITYKDYILGIKTKYEIEKGGIYSCYLSKPSPALLHDYCRILKQSDISKKDQDIINLFYNSPNFDVDKFRPICNFFKGKTENPSQDIIDIMAIMVDFQPRPLGDFLKNKDALDRLEGRAININHLIKKEDSKIIETISELKQDFLQKNKNVVIIGIVIFTAIVTLLYSLFIKPKDCLQWQNDRFVKVDCEVKTNSFVGFDVKVPYNENLLLLRKITPTDTTTYFKNGKAIIWYCKIDENHIELFNAPGHHPVTNKPLRAITKYMVEKYLR